MWRWLLLSLKQYLIFSISIMEKTVSLLRVEVRPGETVSGIKNCLDQPVASAVSHHLPMKSSIFAFHFPFCRIPFLHYFSPLSFLSFLWCSCLYLCMCTATCLQLSSVCTLELAVFTRDPKQAAKKNKERRKEIPKILSTVVTVTILFREGKNNQVVHVVVKVMLQWCWIFSIMLIYYWYDYHQFRHSNNLFNPLKNV